MSNELIPYQSVEGDPIATPKGPTDLAELFARDPLTLTRDDISSIITELRNRRGQYSLGAQKAGSTKPPSAKAKATTELANKVGIKLDLSAILGKKS